MKISPTFPSIYSYIRLQLPPDYNKSSCKSNINFEVFSNNASRPDLHIPVDQERFVMTQYSFMFMKQ